MRMLNEFAGGTSGAGFFAEVTAAFTIRHFSTVPCCRTAHGPCRLAARLTSRLDSRKTSSPAVRSRPEAAPPPFW